ncbi:uncharacterized protein LOC114522887 [Dendronephthya gigantea]|uniref:uncharacterized protein LOC114522887 n=1 Tax=Dendronephthya gigantea TaxID=151771 RepID=UPI00106D1869|nr:uncharacterized protein LOC114522887 [Dendronephthya gigantea]
MFPTSTAVNQVPYSSNIPSHSTAPIEARVQNSSLYLSTSVLPASPTGISTTLISSISLVNPTTTKTETITSSVQKPGLDPGSSNPSSSPDSDTGVIIGAVVAAVVVLVTVIVIVACFRYRRMSPRDKEQNIGEIKNPAFDGETQQREELPSVPKSESDYEEPTEYAQLDKLRRASINANYQSLKHGDYGSGSGAVLKKEGEEDCSKGDYEEMAEYAQLDSSKRVPIDAYYQSLIHMQRQTK